VRLRFAGESGATLALGAALIAAAAAMAQPVETPPDHSQDLAWMNAQQAALAERAAQPGWQAIEGGTLWRRVAGDGSGAHPTSADTVTVHYTGTFVGGGVFDTSEGGEPATFPLGRLIPAWTNAIPQMGVGDTIEIAAPASEAYGTKGKGPIPGGATLLFTVRLLKIGG
jgi:FKBP-type peptidyl-prolyl cis-trans isomerase FkpA